MQVPVAEARNGASLQHYMCHNNRYHQVVDAFSHAGGSWIVELERLVVAAAVICCCNPPQDVLVRVRDASLRHCLQFGVGLHHAGLAEADRQIVERLFVTQKIQVGKLLKLR